MTATPYLDRIEHRSAMSDYLIARLRGRSDDENLHPIAQQLAADGIGLGRAWSRAYGGADSGNELYRSLVQSDFPGMLSHALTTVVGGDSSANARAHRAIAKTIELPDFKTSNFGRVEVGDIELSRPRPDMLATVPTVDVSQFVSGQVTAYSAGLLITRPLLLGDQLAVIQDSVQQVVNALLKVEPRLIAAALETSIPTMPDGSPWIGAGNTTATPGLSVTTLDQAADLLRTSTNNAGSLLDASPAYLVVPSGKEASAHVLVHSLGQPSPIRVVVNSWLSGSYYYLLSDPASEPALLRLVLSGANGEPQIMTRRTPIEYDGLAMVIEHVTGFAAVSRAVARIPAS